MFAKAPRPGEAKTRLCPPLAPTDAAALAAGFLLDTVEASARVPGVSVHLLFSPPDAAAELRQLLDPRPVLLEPQAAGDLGTRLLHAFRHHCAPGASVVAIGSDTPDLPTSRIEQAFHELEADRGDVVLGPAPDGGYYLIGARVAHPSLFEGIPWSSGDVLSLTLARAREHGLRCRLLEAWEDVDTAAELVRLQRRLGGAPGCAPYTRLALSRLRLLAPGDGLEAPSL